MSILWAESYNYTNGDIEKLLEGLWSDRGSAFGIGEAFTYLEVPSWDTTGRYWLKLENRGAALRRALGGGFTSLGMAFSMRVQALPALDTRLFPVEFRDAGNSRIVRMTLGTTGNLTIQNAAGTTVASTSAPVIFPGTTHKIQVEFTTHASTAEIEVRVDNVPVIEATGLAMAGTVAQLAHWINDTSFGPHGTMYIGFSVPYSLTGTYNSSWPAISGVTEVYPNSDTSEDFFTARPRQLFGAGNLRGFSNGSVLDCSTSTDFDLGADDYTLEGWFRFTALPTGSNFDTLMGKWSASTSNRSYRLVKYGPSVNDGALRFEVSTAGTDATVTAVIDVDWDPSIGHWYHIAVCRSSGTTRLFIDGNLYGVPVADALTYYAANAKFTIGGELSGTGTNILSNSSHNGSIDEVRMTPGVARYTANFPKPTAAFPTSAPGDPDFASVALLCNFDEAVVDLSSSPKTIAALGSAVRQEWDDAGFLYEVCGVTNPLDDRFLEAAFLPAKGVLTFNGNPADTETVVLGATTYTFNTVLGGANSVLIGADEAATLSNLLNAINAGTGEGTVYGTGTVQNASALVENTPTSGQLTATAITSGVAGNSIASTTTSSVLAWTGSTLAGGADIPDPTEFTLTPLAPQVTGVRALIPMDRSFVNVDNATFQKSFVVAGDAADGADNTLTASPVYRFDVIEEDPDTTAALTPQSVLNGRLRLTRTS